MHLITFDFHNTLAHCDTWFDLEVFSIASKVALDTKSLAELDTLDAAYRVVRTEVIRSGVEVSAADAVSHVFASNGIELERQYIDSSVHRLMRGALDDLTSVPGAIDAVRFLKAQGHTLGVISSAAHHEFVEWALAIFGILEHFDFVLTSVNAGIYKSRPELYHQALDLVGASPGRSLHIGDSIKWDVETSSLAGMRTAWLRSEQRLTSDVQPDLIFDSLEGSGPVIDQFVRSLT